MSYSPVSQRKYSQEKIRRLMVKLNRDKDADIIQYLEGKNYNIEIKRLLREEMRKQEGTTNV